MTSVFWNLELYQLPKYADFAAQAKPTDPIPYRYCPHLGSDRKLWQGRIAFCMTHMAYMCYQCWKCHAYECLAKVQQ